MTFPSVLHMLFALLWCSLLLASTIGWGSLLLRLCKARHTGPLAESVAGLSLLSVVGGILNLLHWIAPPALDALVLLGALLALAAYAAQARQVLATPRPGPHAWSLPLLALLAFALFAFRYASTVHRAAYIGVDDFEAYLLFPVKMLARHFLAADPFNERRLQSSIGIPYFLQTLLLAKLPIECTQMLDQGFGLAILALASLAAGRAFRLSPNRLTAFVLVAIAMPHIRFNLTMTTLPSGLLLAMAAFAADRDTMRQRSWLPAALIGAATGLTIGCKSTYLPHAFFFCVGYYALRCRELGIRRTVTELGIAAAVCIALLLPWAIAMRSTSGTAFYPVFGHGYDYTAYYHLPPTWTFHTRAALLKVFGFTVPLLPFLFFEFYRFRKSSPEHRDAPASATLALVAAVIAGSIFTGLVAGGDSIRRYNYPCVLPALLFILLSALRRPSADSLRRRWYLPSAAVLLLFWFVYMLSWENVYAEMKKDLWASARAWTVAPAEVPAQYAALERAIPAHGVVLETLDYPFLLNFRDQSFYSADFPAAASLPPGWPIHQDGEALARYLQHHGIRYLAYSYSNGAFLGDESNAAAQTDPQATQAWRNILYLVLQGHRQYGQLAASRKHIYDDGTNYVLDLATPASGLSIPR